MIYPNIDSDTRLHPSSVVMGQVTIGSKSSVWPNATIRGDVNAITIGHMSNIQDNAVLHATHAHSEPFLDIKGNALIVGNYVNVGHGAVLHGCTIHDYTIIGMNAVVLDGAIVESETLVAAGSVVLTGQKLTSGFLYAGNPCKQKRALTERERSYFKYLAEFYWELAIKNL